MSSLRGDRILVAAAAAMLFALTAPAHAAGCDGEYEVRPGDNLSRIAAQCDTSVEALMEANPQITSPARISVGWNLTVPAASGGDEGDTAQDEGISTQDAVVALVEDDGPVNLQGWIINGRRCALLTTPDGQEYGVVSPELSFVSGRAVSVEGRMIDDPTCSGPRTLLVTDLSTTEL